MTDSVGINGGYFVSLLANLRRLTSEIRLNCIVAPILVFFYTLSGRQLPRSLCVLLSRDTAEPMNLLKKLGCIALTTVARRMAILVQVPVFKSHLREVIRSVQIDRNEFVLALCGWACRES